MKTPSPQFEELADLVWALVNDRLDQAGAARLEQLLDRDASNRRVYLELMDQFASLEWETSAARGLVEGRGLGASAPSEAVNGPWSVASESEGRNRESEVPAIIIDTSPAAYSQPAVFPFNWGGWLVSYAAATVFVGLAILGAWVYKVSPDGQLATDSSPRAPMVAVDLGPKPVVVGRITGMADSGAEDIDPSASVTLGSRYVLRGSLLEITYSTGAKVILQGPCTYEVDSARGGFLAEGKLLARVEKRSEVRDQGSEPSPLSPLPSPLFAVRTPTALVTDLGTEFGVEVERSGATRSRVFRGKVEVRVRGLGTSAPSVPGGNPGGGSVIQLAEHDSVRIDPASRQVVTVTRGSADEGNFSFRMPRQMAMSVFNTGLGLKEGQPDPHWQLVARSDDPKFQPRPAVVTRTVDANGTSQWLANDPARSQWLSTAGDLPDLPSGVTFTFRTRFELTGLKPRTAKLFGRYLGDDCVTAIRLNGRPIEVAEASFGGPFNWFHNFSTREGFVEGTNVLEIDVYNGWPGYNPPPTPMLLRVEFDGSYTGTPPSGSPLPLGEGQGVRAADAKEVKP